MQRREDLFTFTTSLLSCLIAFRESVEQLKVSLVRQLRCFVSMYIIETVFSFQGAKVYNNVVAVSLGKKHLTSSLFRNTREIIP